MECAARVGAYEELKKKLSTAPVLSLPDPKLEYVLTTDASDIGIGAVLTQQGKPIAYYSRRLDAAQSRYTVGEKELLGTTASVMHFGHMRDGAKIIVETDHRNLVTALTRYQLNSRMIRFIIYLQHHSIILRYIQGKTNVVAEHLSRYPPVLASLAVFELSNQSLTEHRYGDGARYESSSTVTTQTGREEEWNTVHRRKSICASSFTEQGYCVSPRQCSCRTSCYTNHVGTNQALIHLAQHGRECAGICSTVYNLSKHQGKQRKTSRSWSIVKNSRLKDSNNQVWSWSPNSPRRDRERTLSV